MKKVFIIHGTWSNSEDFWFPYIKNNLSSEEFHVTIPNLPNADNPELEEYLKFLNQYNFDEETIMVGHSSGCPIILSILERRKILVARTIFVAWFSRPLWWEANPILQESYKWEIIQKNCRNFQKSIYFLLFICSTIKLSFDVHGFSNNVPPGNFVTKCHLTMNSRLK